MVLPDIAAPGDAARRLPAVVLRIIARARFSELSWTRGSDLAGYHPPPSGAKRSPVWP